MDKLKITIIQQWQELALWLEKYGDDPEHSAAADFIRDELEPAPNNFFNVPYKGRFKALHIKQEEVKKGRRSKVPPEHEVFVWAVWLLHSQTKAAKVFDISVDRVKSCVKNYQESRPHLKELTEEMRKSLASSMLSSNAEELIKLYPQ